jgi:hypothetical protein
MMTKKIRCYILEDEEEEENQDQDSGERRRTFVIKIGV